MRSTSARSEKPSSRPVANVSSFLARARVKSSGWRAKWLWNSVNPANFTPSSKFVLATGGTKTRSNFYDKMLSLGGNPFSVIADSSIIHCQSENLGDALNIMEFSFIGPHTSIGKGCLINCHASIHHDSKIGKFVEIAPGAKILGGAIIDDFAFIGTNAVVFPNVRIGSDSVIGAGCMVKRDFPANSKMK